MSNSKESTLKTQFSISGEFEAFEDSDLISGAELDECFSSSGFNNNKKIQDLLSEIDLINEDRARLRQENEKLKYNLSQKAIQKMQIQLLQQIATKALAENYNFKQKAPKSIPPTLLNSVSCIKLRSPSDIPPIKIPLKNNTSLNIKKDPNVCSTDTSPLKSQRTTSSRIRVTRNNSKYPRVNNTKLQYK
jgi:hypothetical protein